MSFSQLRADRGLARQIATGDVEAFDAFFEEYFPRLFRFVMARTDGNEDLSEEVVQRTMCRVIDKMGSYRGEALLFSWLCQICRNELATVLQKYSIEFSNTVPFEDIPEIRAALESIAADPNCPDNRFSAIELGRIVRVTLAHIPINYATALELKYLRGYSVVEIGGELRISSKAAESVLSRARAAFKEGFRSLWDFEPDFLLD